MGIVFIGCGCLALLLSLAVAGYGFYAHQTEMTKRERRPVATGTVVDLASRIGRSGHLYHPVVEFRTPDGETVKFESEFGSMPASQKVGNTVSVRYNPANPSDAGVDSGLTKWTTLGIAGLLAAIILCLGLAFLGTGLFSYMVGF